MDTISHREMRNQSARVLQRVQAGESLLITNHGRPVAEIIPASEDRISALIARGQARPPRAALSSLNTITRTTPPDSTRDILADTRGRW